VPSTTANGRRGIESAERSGPQSRDRRYADVIALGQFREGRALSPATLLFGPDGTDQGQRRPKLWAAAAHSNGIASFTLTLRRKLTRLEFAMALALQLHFSFQM
jgi:hypothetical protein